MLDNCSSDSHHKLTASLISLYLHARGQVSFASNGIRRNSLTEASSAEVSVVAFYLHSGEITLLTLSHALCTLSALLLFISVLAVNYFISQ